MVPFVKFWSMTPEAEPDTPPVGAVKNFAGPTVLKPAVMSLGESKPMMPPWHWNTKHTPKTAAEERNVFTHESHRGADDVSTPERLASKRLVEYKVAWDYRGPLLALAARTFRAIAL